MRGYQERIQEELYRQGREDIDPRHVEGWMRCSRGTLDGLSKHEFNIEVEIGVGCIDIDGAENAEELARSYGL